MQKAWWEDPVIFLCKFWWIILLLLLLGLAGIATKDLWLPPKNEANTLSDVIVDQADIQIAFSDNRSEDGDLIRVEINGELILDNYLLTNAVQLVPVHLEKSKNFVKITALNEGIESPNTVEVQVSNVIQGNAIQVTEGMLTGQVAEFSIAVK